MGAGGGPQLISMAPVISLRIATLGALHPPERGIGGAGATGGAGIFEGPPVGAGVGAGAAGGGVVREGPPVVGAGMVGGFGITTCGIAPGAGWPLGSDMGRGGMGCCGIADRAAAA
jgi:hypothetical protein